MPIRKEQKQGSSIFYLIDEENRTITAKIPVDSAVDSFYSDCNKRDIFGWYDGELEIRTYGKYFVGVAKCAPEDTFDIEIGKRLARDRALKKFYKAKLRAFHKMADLFDKDLKTIEDYMDYSWLAVNRFLDDEGAICRGEN
jgi:hypothetical protein